MVRTEIFAYVMHWIHVASIQFDFKSKLLKLKKRIVIFLLFLKASCDFKDSTRFFNTFVPNAPFLYPFYKAVEKECIRNEWDKRSSVSLFSNNVSYDHLEIVIP